MSNFSQITSSIRPCPEVKTYSSKTGVPQYNNIIFDINIFNFLGYSISSSYSSSFTDNVDVVNNVRKFNCVNSTVYRVLKNKYTQI